MAKWGTKNPPNRAGLYLVTIKTSYGKQVRQATRLEYPKGSWHWSILPSGGIISNVIAWQRCPEPYEN